MTKEEKRELFDQQSIISTVLAKQRLKRFKALMRNCTANAFEHYSHAAKHVHFCLANVFEKSLETRQSSPAIIAGTGMFQCVSVLGQLLTSHL